MPALPAPSTWRFRSVTPVTYPSTKMPTPREFRNVLSSIRMFENACSYSAPSARVMKPSRSMWRLLRKPSTRQFRTVMFDNATSVGAMTRMP